jgi:cytochrome P450
VFVQETITDQQLRDVIINFLVAGARSAFSQKCSVVLTSLFAGRDTTATALSWFFYEMTQNPSVEEQVLAEIDSVRSHNFCG